MLSILSPDQKTTGRNLTRNNIIKYYKIILFQNQFRTQHKYI